MAHPSHRRPNSAGAGPEQSSTLRRRLRVLLADDHPGVRAGLRETLSDHAELVVVGEAGDGIEAVALAHALQPDVVVMDVVMPRLDGVAATRQLRSELPHVLVLGLSTEIALGRHPIEDAGAAGYFAKADGAGALIGRLLAIHARTGGR